MVKQKKQTIEDIIKDRMGKKPIPPPENIEPKTFSTDAKAEKVKLKKL